MCSLFPFFGKWSCPLFCQVNCVYVELTESSIKFVQCDSDTKFVTSTDFDPANVSTGSVERQILRAF